jgi:hypothetical protein
MNALTTRRTLARQPAALPATRQTIDVVPRPPVADEFIASPPPHQPLISTELLERIVAFLVGAFVGAWLMGMAG